MNDVIAGQPMWVWAAVGGGGLALIVLVVIVVMMASRKPKPKPAQRTSAPAPARAAPKSAVPAAAPAAPSAKASPAPGPAPVSAAAPASTAAPRKIEFGAGTPNDGHLGSGWSDPEEWGVWSNDDRAILSLPLPAVFPAELQFECSGFVNEKLPLQEVKVSVGDVQLASWSWAWGAEDPETRILIVPSPPAGKDNLKVVFAFSNATSPDFLGLNGDKRRLSMALRSATV